MHVVLVGFSMNDAHSLQRARFIMNDTIIIAMVYNFRRHPKNLHFCKFLQILMVLDKTGLLEFILITRSINKTN